MASRSEHQKGHVAYSILVMDDETIVRETVTFMLEYLGYNVTTCANGEEAIALYSDAHGSRNPYIAVLMDLTIYGGMGGKDAAKEILLVDPNAKLIVSSGYSDDPVMANHRSYGFRALLPKPYKVSGLADVLATLNSL
jgi:two-component system, cell cycle sensor histidine kinase and response regulator CckA